jgi:hypothetical protein
LAAPRWWSVTAEIFDERFCRLWPMGRRQLYMCNAAQNAFSYPAVSQLYVCNSPTPSTGVPQKRSLAFAQTPGHLLAVPPPSIGGCGPSIRGFAMLASDCFGSAVLSGSLAAGTLRDGRRLIPFDSPTACGSETGNARMANRRGGHRAVLARSQEALFIVFTRGAPFRPRLPSQDQRRD